MIALCTVLCGGETCADMALFGPAKHKFLQQFLTLPHGIPDYNKFSHIFRLLNPARFHALVHRLSCSGLPKAAKGLWQSTARRCGAPSTVPRRLRHLHLVSAWAADARLCLGQLAVGDKSNKIVAVPKLLELLSLKGRVVTGRRDELPAQDRPAGYRSGRRLRAGA